MSSKIDRLNPETPDGISPDARYNTVEAAKYLGFHRDTLARFRMEGRGPRFFRVGGLRIFYLKRDLDAWVGDQYRRSQS